MTTVFFKTPSGKTVQAEVVLEQSVSEQYNHIGHQVGNVRMAQRSIYISGRKFIDHSVPLNNYIQHDSTVEMRMPMPTCGCCM